MNEHIDRILFLVDTLHQTGADLANTQAELADATTKHEQARKWWLEEQSRRIAADTKVAQLEATLAELQGHHAELQQRCLRQRESNNNLQARVAELEAAIAKVCQ